MMKLAILIIYVLISFLSCAKEEHIIDPERFIPLKIGVLEYDEANITSHIKYLKIGEEVITRISCNYEGMDTVNINILFEYEGGSCTVISENQDIQISRGKDAIMFYHTNMHTWLDRTFVFEETINNAGYLAINPFGSDVGHMNLYNSELVDKQAIYSHEPPGYEYYLTVNAFDFADQKDIVDARLKIKQLPDVMGEKSHLFSIEMVEYELSDTYKMMLE